MIIWGERAVKLAQYLTKGKAISVTGRLELIRTQTNNTVYVTPRVVVDTLEFLGKKTIESVSAEEKSTDLDINNLETNTEEIPDDQEVPF